MVKGRPGIDVQNATERAQRGLGDGFMIAAAIVIYPADGFIIDAE